MDSTTVLKKCTTCSEEKPITEFHVRRKSKDGYRTQCKACVSLLHSKPYASKHKEKKSIANKEWCKANKENRKAYKKAYNAAHKEQNAITKKTWDEKNKERRAEYRKNYYEANKEAFREASSVWKKDNVEKTLASNRNRRAMRKNANGTHTVADIQNLFNLQNRKCAVCKKSIAKEYHVDHVIALSKGGSNDKHNLQLLCVNCNCSKYNKDPIEFMQQRGFLL